jgi:ABC-type Fe3+ transport system substrate-binding protein
MNGKLKMEKGKLRIRFKLSLGMLLSAFLGSGISGVFAAQAMPAWQIDWERTVEAAKKEGQVAVYISGYEEVLPEFQKDFPEIKVHAVTGRGSQMAQRLLTERRGDKYLADVFNSGGVTTYGQLHKAKVLDTIKPLLLLPEVTDTSKWYQKKHHYTDPEGQYVFSYVGSATYGSVSYNTKLVDPKEIKSYWDLLDPKWKGKIIARDIRVPGPGSGNARFFYHHPELGAAYIRKMFGEMDITLFRDYRQGPDWLAVGKYPICFFCDVDLLKQQGLPVDTFGPKSFKEGGALVQQFGTITLINRAPHPNAAKVFINWLLSRKGQITLQKVLVNSENPADSLRIDIPKDDVPMLNRRMEGINYIDTSKPGWQDMKPVLQIMNEALRAAGKS